MSGSVLPSALKVISNPIRRAIIQLLSEEKMTYIELLSSIGLDFEKHRGWFNYHLEVLLAEGITSKDQDHYALTEFGKNTATLLEAIERESRELFQKELTSMKKEEVTVAQKAPSITIEEIPHGKLTISLDPKQPLWWRGEQKTYMDTASVPQGMETEYGRNNYYVETCLDRLYLPKKEEYHYVRSFDVYQSRYDGTEENRRIVQRTEEGYFHSLWTKIWEIQKHDGLYETKRVEWCIRGPTEPEEQISDPPEKILGLPSTLKIGDSSTEKHKLFDAEGMEFGEAISEEKILGEYVVKSAKSEHHCLLSRTKTLFALDPSKPAGKSWKRVKDRFIGKDGTVVLDRMYDTAQGLQRFGRRIWENNPAIEYEGETYYLWDEDYLAKRYIPPVNLGRIKHSV